MGALITFSSDYGPTDEFVGVCHLVIARIAPDVRVLDVAHGLRGIRGGSVVLAQSLTEAPVGAVHLAVVDPGVGTERRPVVIVCGNGSVLVGPDNGIFFPVADLLGGVVSAHELVDAAYRGPVVSTTFHGRDIFAPAAAHLAIGVVPEAFGPAVTDLVRLPPPDVRVGDGVLEAEVVRSDWFGNLQLAATGVDLAGCGLSGAVLVNGVDATVVEKFADVEAGTLLVYVNSAGHVAVAANRTSARELLHDPERVTLNAKA
jgi:S-adenosyl-L-methionine hydrolase (adenosine-forming)